MKKLINRPEAVVEEMVEGFAAIFPGLQRLPGRSVLVRTDAAGVREGRVAILSGGGSRHEPAHAGYVGRGMLSAAVAGGVFTSPDPMSILAAIRAVTGPPGALLIVKNDSGDRLNFGLAAELAQAEGLDVEMVIVADDVALAENHDRAFAGRRGLAGTVLVHKIAGAAAEAGASLDEVADEARAAAEAVRTIGVTLPHRSIPAMERPGLVLADDQIALGPEIDGEPGWTRPPDEGADAIIDRLIGAVLNDAELAPGARTVLMVNNLGGAPLMEVVLVARRAIADLEDAGLVIERVYAGHFLTALEMEGVSLSILPVDDRRLGRLDAPTQAPAWPNAAARPRTEVLSRASPPDSEPETRPAVTGPPSTAVGQRLDASIRAVASALEAEADRLDELDRAVGDGDLGLGLSRGASAVVAGLDSWPLDDPSATLRALGMTLQEAVGGTSGPLYAVLCLRASAQLRESDADDPATWAEALHEGCRGVAELGMAGPGDGTMLDALLPAADALADALKAGRPPGEALREAVAAAEAGLRATVALLPRRGRASDLGERALGHPDPGAAAVAIWLRAIATALL